MYFPLPPPFMLSPARRRRRRRETTNDERRRHSRRRRICIHAHRAVEAQPHSATEEALGFACQDVRAGRRTRLLAFHPRSKSLGSRIRSGIRCFFRCRALSGKLSLIELSRCGWPFPTSCSLLALISPLVSLVCKLIIVSPSFVFPYKLIKLTLQCSRPTTTIM